MRLAWSCGALAATIALGACTGDPGASVSPTPSSTMPSASPSPTVSETPTPAPSPSPTPEPSPTEFQSFPPPPAGETEEQAAIREGWEAYNHVLDKFLRDPELTDLTETQHVTTGEESNRVIDEIALTREANVHIDGHQRFRDVTMGEVTEINGVRQATVSYCFDPSEMIVLDSSTREPVGDSPAETFVAHDRLELQLDMSWRVAEHRTEDRRC